jgi:hypothetical protein
MLDAAMLCASSGVALARSLAVIFGISARDWKSEKWPSFEQMITPLEKDRRVLPFLPPSISLVTATRVHADNLFFGGFLLSKCDARQREAKPDGDETAFHRFPPHYDFDCARLATPKQDRTSIMGQQRASN